MRKLTRDEWIVKAIERHGDGKYDYSLVEYVDSHTKVKIRCIQCGDVFEQKAYSHSINGRGCPKCGRRRTVDRQRISKSEWISRSTDIHGNKYSYHLVEFSDTKTPVEIFCTACNDSFMQTPSNHLYGKQGCYQCGRRQAAKNLTYTLEEWIARSIKVHGNKYAYTGIDLVDHRAPVRIMCLSCNESFMQSFNNHVNQRQGCPRCGHRRTADSHRLECDEWISRSRDVHGDKYKYESVNYVNKDTKVEIYCVKCEIVFAQTPGNHLYGKQGCPRCNESRGEKLISTVLYGLAVEHERQKRFDACRSKQPLPFDFYLPGHNICIEYHGEQHYEAITHFGGEKALRSRQRRDKIKAKFCKDNGIHLEVIPHWLDESQVRAIIARLAHVQLSLF